MRSNGCNPSVKWGVWCMWKNRCLHYTVSNTKINQVNLIQSEIVTSTAIKCKDMLSESLTRIWCKIGCVKLCWFRPSFYIVIVYKIVSTMHLNFSCATLIIVLPSSSFLECKLHIDAFIAYNNRCVSQCHRHGRGHVVINFDASLATSRLNGDENRLRSR